MRTGSGKDLEKIIIKGIVKICMGELWVLAIELTWEILLQTRNVRH